MNQLPSLSRLRRLQRIEKEIRSRMEQFHYVGREFTEIRDGELYKQAGFESWDDYCRERWGWDRPYIERLIQSGLPRKS